MAGIVLDVEVRERTGTGNARAVRRSGMVPGVLYGGDRGPVAIAVQEKVLVKALRSGKFLAHMVELSHKGERQPVIPKAVQFHPVTDVPVHFDLFRVDENAIIDVEVAVHFINHELSPGLKAGGALNIVRHTVELHVPAGRIPEFLTVDLTGRDFGDVIHVSNIVLPEGVKPTIRDRDFTIATITSTGAAAEAAAAAEAG